MTPGQRGRRTGRLMLAVAVGVALIEGILFIGAPKFVGPEPMFMNPAGSRDAGVPAGLLILGVAAVLLVVGLVWMLRANRADPEPDQHAWRYRERD